MYSINRGDMSKGGYKKNNKVESNHLFKPKWNNKKTVAIRVPEVFKSTLLKIARHLDKTTVISLDDQKIINDVANCFRYKELWTKYKNRTIELRQDKRELFKQIDNLDNKNKQKNNQDKYELAVKCFGEFLESQNLNIEDLSKARKGTKKNQLYEINQWLIKKSANLNS